MNTIFRRVSVKERPPKEDGDYVTNYSLNTKLLTCTDKRKWTIKAGGDTLTVTPDYWLEEIQLPSAEEIERCSCPDLEIDKGGWKRGAEWMMLLAVGCSPNEVQK
jgi:hypothetical protein